MKTEKAVVGIDISKANFDVCIRRKRQEKHAVFENHNQGHRVFNQMAKKRRIESGRHLHGSHGLLMAGFGRKAV